MRYFLTLILLAISTSCYGWGANAPSFAVSTSPTADYTPVTAKFLFGSNSGPSGTAVKVCIWQNDSVLVACSDPITKTLGSVGSGSITGSSELPIGTYKLGIVVNGYIPFAGLATTGGVSKSLNSYTTPINLASTIGEAAGKPAIWLENSAGQKILGDNNTADKTSQYVTSNGNNYAYSISFTRDAL